MYRLWLDDKHVDLSCHLGYFSIVICLQLQPQTKKSVLTGILELHAINSSFYKAS